MSRTVPPFPFDVRGPLPGGVTLLEASAGTGKTFTIAALTARYVAEGLPLDRLLLVTFGRAATGELRTRVRDRLVSAESGLARAAQGSATDPDDSVLDFLRAVPAAELILRRDRLARALADFDAATIATTHGFCQQVLTGIGFAGDFDPDTTFVEEAQDLVDEVTEDRYLRRFAAQGPPAGFGLAMSRKIGRAVVEQPAATIVPAPDGPTLPAMRARLAHVVRGEFELRKRRLRIVTFDDLLTRLAAAVADPVTAARLRARFDVVMIDEFQDTDPLQWDIVRTAFGDGGSTLVLIGDPKQAIYAFRGADVHTYLEAAAAATTTATLDVNWRSDQALVDAYDALFDAAVLGHPGIRYRPVRAADGHRRPGLRGAPHGEALRISVVHRDDGRVDLTPAGWATNASARQQVADDVAADIVELLTSRAELVTYGDEGSEGRTEPSGPGHVAVLVSTHRQGALVREALEDVGVPAVIAGAGSVFGTAVAKEWLTLLEALERPSSVARVHAAALTSFVGWPAVDVATADDATWEPVFENVHDWTTVLRDRGVAALLETITRGGHLARRVLGREDGERELTDVRHVGQLLHHESITDRLGVSALAAWLRARITEAADDVHDEDRSRRLESDSAAVQVLTIHRCKGLEFPVVYCPFLWLPPHIPADQLPLFHDPAAGGRRAIDVGGDTHPDHAAHDALHAAELHGEALRLAYVALTRARHQAVVHWASVWDSRSSPLARILFASSLGPDQFELAKAPTESEVVERAHAIANRAAGAVGVERTMGARGLSWSPPEAAPTTLVARRFDRVLDTSWRRASYTGLTSVIGEHQVASEPDTRATTDEHLSEAFPAAVAGADAGGTADEQLRHLTLPLAAMAGGARVGTVVHAVLEHTDFTATDLAGSLHDALAEELAGTTTTIGPADSVVDGLALAIDTPLGALAGDVRLRDIDKADRLDELEFELPLVGGDAPTGVLDMEAIAGLFARHLPPGDGLAGYDRHLHDPRLAQRVCGYLTGSIDAVLRLRGQGGGTRFAVVDYKTNWLADAGTEISAWHYRPEALAATMQHAHYPLQALFYVVALHRYLRWRLAGYDPDGHLAGVLYLFLRGMIGPDTPVTDSRRCGVFAWRPPTALVIEASDLFDRGAEGRRG